MSARNYLEKVTGNFVVSCLNDMIMRDIELNKGCMYCWNDPLSTYRETGNYVVSIGFMCSLTVLFSGRGDNPGHLTK